MSMEGSDGFGEYRAIHETVACSDEDDGPPDDSGEWVFAVIDTFSEQGPKRFWQKQKPKLVWFPDQP